MNAQEEFPFELPLAPTPPLELPQLEVDPEPATHEHVGDQLARELDMLQCLDPAAQLRRCKARIRQLASELTGGSTKVLLGALYLAAATKIQPRKPTETPGSNESPDIEFGMALLRAHGIGSSSHNVRRLLKIGNLGLQLYKSGIVLPDDSASLQAVLDAKLKDQIEGCRRLVAAHEGRFPAAAAVEAFFGKAQKCTEDVGKQSPWRTVKTWTDEGVDLVDQGASRQQIRAVFEKIAELAKARCGAGKPKKRKRTTPAAKAA